MSSLAFCVLGAAASNGVVDGVDHVPDSPPTATKRVGANVDVYFPVGMLLSAAVTYSGA